MNVLIRVVPFGISLKIFEEGPLFLGVFVCCCVQFSLEDLFEAAGLMAEGYFVGSGFCPYLLAEVGGWVVVELLIEAGYFLF